jgi:hypothetical protein
LATAKVWVDREKTTKELEAKEGNGKNLAGDENKYLV